MFSTFANDDPSIALLTDQYQLSMAYGYWKNAMAEREAEFHMFYRSNPFNGGFVVFAGLGSLIDALNHFQFSAGDIEYLQGLTDARGNSLFENAFLDYLKQLRFRADIDAVAEGTIVFPNEVLIRVRGPLLQVQIIETMLLNTVNFQSLVATKAARIGIAAQGDPVMDFGLRRAQGMNGAVSAARGAYIGGVKGTSNVLAGKLLGIPVVGTHAHSWVMAFPSEREAFAAYAEAMPGNCVFLVDTYGTLSGVRNAIGEAKKLRERGFEMIGIRLDSGDLAYFSKQARQLLDEAGFSDAAIAASNELDEYVITSLKMQHADINLWGVGTKLITAYDDPALSGVYKLAAIRDSDGHWQYKMKISEQKAKMSIPGLLQVHRFFNERGLMVADAIGEASEDPKDIDEIINPNDNLNRRRITERRSEPLLAPLYRRGKPLFDAPSLEKIRARVSEQLALLDDSHKRFEYPHIYPVGLSPNLNQIRDRMISQERDRIDRERSDEPH